jgi:ubiquinone biosynthesis protein UbiJ
MDDNLAKELVAMWQSELTAMTADRELRESWAGFIALWAQSATLAAAYLPRDQAGSTSAAEPPRPAPAAAASEPRLDEIERLERRIAELEQRLGTFMERDRGGPAEPQPGV